MGNPPAASAGRVAFAYTIVGPRLPPARPQVPADMSDFTQFNRPIQITVEGVPDDGVAITALSGGETLSRLSRYTCELSVPHASPVEFGQLLGRPVVVSVFQESDQWRYVRGLFCRVTETGRNDRFSLYEAELVPPLWLLTRNRRSRLFQHQTTEEVIREVVGKLYDLGDAFKLEGTYHPRNICAQYHESDFDFFSRLLEEEGWYYYFTDTEAAHGLVIADNPRGHLPVSVVADIEFAAVDAPADGGRITSWTKTQELRTASFTLTDHSFEMPPNTLEVVETLSGEVAAGTVSHPVLAAGDPPFDATDHPGGYVRWRDGIAPGGAERPDDLKHVFDDNKRLVRVRAEAELAGAVEIAGASTCSQLTPGHTFTLTEHPDANGEYLVTSVRHRGQFGSAMSGTGGSEYSNSFACIPAGVTYRPPRETRKPAIHGTQTAVVVGADGAEIDPDKYGRVKVWFRWDPAGRRGLDSSCWVRVATPWAGKQWGMVHIPRVGDEVVVAFENGDPDQPLIVGSLWNADNMPIYKLPDNKTQSGIKTHSSSGGGTHNYNEIKFEDKKGGELVGIHAEKDMSVTVEDNYTVSIGADQKDPKKAGKSSSTTYGDTSYTVTKGDYAFTVATGKAEYTVEGLVQETFNTTQTTVVNKEIDVSSTTASIHLTSPTEILLTVKGSFIKITPDTITLFAKNIHFEGGTEITGKAPLVKFEGTDKFEALAPQVAVDGKTAAVFQSSGGKADVTAATKATLGVSGQTVVCDPAAVAISGAMVKSAASGVHEITGALVKIN